MSNIQRLSNGNNNQNNNGQSSPITGDIGILGYTTLGIGAITGIVANIFRRKRK